MQNSCSMETPALQGSCSTETPVMQVTCSTETPAMQGSCSTGTPALQGSCSMEIPLSGDLALTRARPTPHLRSRSARRGLWESWLQGGGHRAGRSLPVGPHSRPVHTSPQRPHFPHLRKRFPPASNAASLVEAPPGSAPRGPETAAPASRASPEVPPVARAQCGCSRPS